VTENDGISSHSDTSDSCVLLLETISIWWDCPENALKKIQGFIPIHELEMNPLSTSPLDVRITPRFVPQYRQNLPEDKTPPHATLFNCTTQFATCQNVSFHVSLWQKSRKLALYNKKPQKYDNYGVL